MKGFDIVPFGDPVLRETCADVERIDGEIITLLDRLKRSLYEKKGRAAIAAPQVGRRLRIVVLDYGRGYQELINPAIVERYGEGVDFEGCLSFPGFSGRVARARKAVLTYLDRHGVERTADSGMNADLARCYQHEVDHLDGILFIDKVVDGFLVSDRGGDPIDLAGVKRLAGGR